MTVPAAWMPKAKLQRIVFHWTAGTHKASPFDREHYHVLIEADGNVVRGVPTIDGNGVGSARGRKASHTLNCNTGSIGVSLCCMGGPDVREQPFIAGRYPMTRVQWEKLAFVLADLCRVYDIAVTPKTVLSHAEVQSNLGIKQRQKWDVSRLAFDPTVKGAKVCGDQMRAMVKQAMNPITTVAGLVSGVGADDGEPDDPVLTAAPVTEKVEQTAAEDAARELAVSDITSIQRRLKALKYHELGLVDGQWGGRLAAAIAAFKNDRHLSGEPVIDDALKEDLSAAEAEGWTRPISQERANMQAPEVAPKLETVNQTWYGQLWAWIVGLPAMLFASLKTYFGDADGDGMPDIVRTIMDNIERVPAKYYAFGIAAIAIAIVVHMSIGKRAAVRAAQEGRLFAP